MIKFNQNILLVLLLTACLGIHADEASKSDRADSNKSARSNKTQQCELTYLKNKKNFYRSLSIFSKTAVVLNGCSLAYFFYKFVNPNTHYMVSMWYSKQAQLAIGSACILFFLSKWLDLEQIPLDAQITDLESELAIA